jgi:hypothetical protein
VTVPCEVGSGKEERRWLLQEVLADPLREGEREGENEGEDEGADEGKNEGEGVSYVRRNRYEVV